jgi:predicted transcriptional regulator of viral defense system
MNIKVVKELASQGVRLFKSDQVKELALSCGIESSNLNKFLYRLKKEGWIIPIKKGAYALSPILTGSNPIHEFELAMALSQPAAISHWSAMHYHHITDQIPRMTFVLITTVTRSPRISHKQSETPFDLTSYHLTRINPGLFFGIQKVWIGEVAVCITDLERTLLDGLANPQYCGGFLEVLNAFKLSLNQIEISKIIDYALKLNVAIAKRLGWVLQHQGIEMASLKKLIELPIKGYRKLDASLPPNGKYNQQWMVQENI